MIDASLHRCSNAARKPPLVSVEPATSLRRCRGAAIPPYVRASLERLVAASGPGYLAGITFDIWWRLLRENRFAIAPRYLPRATVISLLGLCNSLAARSESYRATTAAHPPQPLFIIGHWRSGTTHLLNLLARDPRFVAPTLADVVFPTACAPLRSLWSRLLGPLIPEGRSVDGMSLSLAAPEEDERALSALTGRSPYLSMVFPKRERDYDRYLTLRAVTADERTAWQRALLGFAAGLTRGSGRVPLFKSPPNTCRIRLILECFPGARFVHVHRNPYEVFQSTRHLLSVWHARHALQHRDLGRLDDRVIHQYREMYEAFFEERCLIPRGQYHELAFDGLTRWPVRELHTLYKRLSLPEFDAARPGIERYLASVADYKRNQYAEIPRSTRERIAQRWSREFNEWGYDANA